MNKKIPPEVMRYLRIAGFLKRTTYYEEYEEQAIRSYAKNENMETIMKTDLIREVYDELGILPEDKNIYIIFQQLVDELYGLEGKNIVEVGGGILPRLGERIHLQQKTGTITVYDPRLGRDIKGNERFILKREYFKADTPTDQADLLIGLMPCKGAEPLLDNALKNNKDFVLWLCEGGPHGDYFDYFETDEEWLDSTMYHAKRGLEEKNMGKLMIKKIPEISEYPIIYNQR